MRNMQWQLGILGTISAFAFRHKETKKINVLELFVLHAFQTFFYFKCLEVPENWSRFCPSETNCFVSFQCKPTTDTEV